MWASGMEQQVRSVVDQLLNSTVTAFLPLEEATVTTSAALLENLPWYSHVVLRHRVDCLQAWFYDSWFVEAVGFALRLLDIPEGLAYLVQTVPGHEIGVIASTATRRNDILYYGYMMGF